MKKIRKLRKQRNLSLRNLEELSGVDYSTISRIENGEYLPTLRNLWKLSKALKVGVAELIDEEEMAELAR